MGRSRNRNNLNRLLLGANSLSSLSRMNQSKEKKDSWGELTLPEVENILVKVSGKFALKDKEEVIS